MLLQILSRTPLWVFALFAALVALGVLQSRTREVGRMRVLLLPAVFLPLSLWGVWNAFGAQALAFAAWLAGLGAALLLHRLGRPPRPAAYSAATGRYQVEGSWIPLALMMVIFFARYAIAVATAIRPELSANPAFFAAAGFAYGLFSGTFLARALRILAGRASATEAGA